MRDRLRSRIMLPVGWTLFLFIFYVRVVSPSLGPDSRRLSAVPSSLPRLLSTCHLLPVPLGYHSHYSRNLSRSRRLISSRVSAYRHSLVFLLLLLLCGDVEPNPGPLGREQDTSLESILPRVDSTPLAAEDLYDIKSGLISIAASWKAIGRGLRLDSGQLDEIGVKHPFNPKECLSEVLAKWLKKDYNVTRFGEPTWQQIVEIVASPAAGSDPALALTIAKKHSLTADRQEETQDQTEESDIKSSGLVLAQQSESDVHGLTEPGIGIQGTAASHLGESNASVLTSYKTPGASTLSEDPESSDAVAIHRPCTVFGCGCGECTLQIVQNCPNPMITKSGFPYMDTTGLTRGQEDVLSGKLLEEHSLIKRQFQRLVFKTLRSLEKRGVGPKDLVGHLMGLQALDPILKGSPPVLFQDRIEKMLKCTSIQDVLLVVWDSYSFFNYGLIEDIILDLGSEDDKEMLLKYKRDFENYCERRIYETPCLYGPSGDCSVVMKIDNEFEKYTLNELKRFIFKLTKIFNITQHTLRLESVEKGCIQLNFQIPDFIAKQVFPLSRDQEKALKSEDVIEITCGNYYISLKETSIKPTPQDRKTSIVSVSESTEMHGSRSLTTLQGSNRPISLKSNSSDTGGSGDSSTSGIADEWIHLVSSDADLQVSRHSRGDRHRANIDRLASDYISRRCNSTDTDDDGVTLNRSATSRRTRRTCHNCKTLQQQVQELQEDLRAFQRQVQELQEDLRVSRTQRERLEQSNERLHRDFTTTLSNDLQYEQLCRENEKLQQDIKRLQRETSDPDSDRTYDRQYEDLKRLKEDMEDELLRDRVSLKAYKKECSALKALYNSLKLKNEELQRANWRVVDENQKLMVQLMDEDKASTYHFAGKDEVTRYPSSRPQKSRVEMKRTSSAGQALDSDFPFQDQDTGYLRGKSMKSVPSDISEALDFVTVSTTPDNQSQVFMVLDEDVSQSVLPEGLSKDSELAMIYALQNCHSIQELIKCVFSYGMSASDETLQAFQVENDHLKQCVGHLKSKNVTLSHSFDCAKSNTESMYYRVQSLEANNTRLLHALKLCEQAVEVFEVLFEFQYFDSRPHGSNPSFPEFNSLESSTRSPDRELVYVKHSSISRARNLLHFLDSNTELQNYLPGSRSRQGGSDYHQTAHWAGTLSQNTSNTSGLSSMSGGMEGEITHGELERLRSYTQALVNYRERLLTTMAPIDGLQGLETVKKCEILTDCIPAGEYGKLIVDLEDAANAEELGRVREEKAELRSQIYMMEQEKRRMELEVSRMLLHKQKCDRMLQELQFIVKEERRKRKKEKKGRKGDATMPLHDQSKMSELSIEYQSALEREQELSRRYEGLFGFLSHHVKNSEETSTELMRFVKALRRANSALVDAFEKAKKRQQAEKKRMKQELVSYMNKVQGTEEPTNSTLSA